MNSIAKPRPRRFVKQPEPSTAGLSKEMVRDHAWELYRERLIRGFSLTREDWTRAEQDLADKQMTTC